jgi:hypothetical protein
MGLGDFFNGVKEAGGKVLDVASGPIGDKVIDVATEPLERAGQAASAAGQGINWLGDRAGDFGDRAQAVSDAAGLPKPVGSVSNFLLGGETQWGFRSVGDTAQTLGFVGQNIDTAQKGALQGANYAYDNPSGVGNVLQQGANYAANHKMDIAQGVGKAALDEATDPVSLALMVGTGGGSAVLKGVANAGARGTARGALSATARETAESLVKGATREGIEEVVETGAKSASKGLIRDTFSGTNLPASQTPGALGKMDRALEMGAWNPTGRTATFRRGLADKIAGEGGVVRETLANAVTPGNVKPVRGGEAAANAWRAKRLTQQGRRLDRVGSGAEIAADPKGWATNKMFGNTDTSSTGSVQDVTRSSASITGDLGQRSAYSNEYTPRGFKQPSILPSRGAGELTSGQSSAFQVRDPYAEGTEYGQPGTTYNVRDPYKPLVQPKKKSEGMYSV